MKTALSLALCVGAAATAFAQAPDTTFFHFKDGQLVVIPQEYVVDRQEDNQFITMNLTEGKSFKLSKYALKEETHTAPELPVIESFKFNNDYNDQLYTTANGVIDHAAGTITVSPGCIGKTLVASVKLPDAEDELDTQVWVEGKHNISKVTRRRFDRDYVYTVARPRNYIFKAGEFVPYGRDYTVHVDFLTDHPTSKYNVPRIDITFGDGTTWGDSQWIGMNGKKTWEKATIKIDGSGVYPDMAETEIKIRGRGNSSWEGKAGSKNPYRFKFDKKQKPLGMKNGKNWVLLANKVSGSMTTNALAMKIADLVGTDACNHIVPVELYINGHYRGSYNLTEKIGISNNSIDLEDESKAALLELDTYYDEDFKFHDDHYNFPVNIKDPDLADPETAITLDQIKAAFNNFCALTKEKEGFVNSVDSGASALHVESYIRGLLVTELTNNNEIKHPKSMYFYTEDATDVNSPWHYGPMWDFDSAFGWDHGFFNVSTEHDMFAKIQGNGQEILYNIYKRNELVQKEYFRLWDHFMNDGLLDELLEYCDDYYAFVKPSFDHNNSGNDYAEITARSKEWLKARAEFLYSKINKFDIEKETDPWASYGEPDGQLDNVEDAAVGEIETDNDEPVAVFSITGVRVATLRPSEINSANLPAGVYVAGNRKFIVK